MERIVDFIDTVLVNHDQDAKIAGVKTEINNWMKQFPLYI
jgi:glycine hydroxymethyltransferase